ncbi:MAG: hypothetical protein RHS_1227 [Robinsoniella sp. RHS]|uniref:type II 3-dehydroquinate dehydratase n=1 Tax=Robinsoniella sp. RHS TaxID=1504536 RepID=UPI0006581E9D|nr:MAG: hypothetical protein RHS_1227 [Robinsoniella sp. RHS]
MNVNEIAPKRIAIALINGPNINLLGTREQQFYGKETLPDIEKQIKSLADELLVDILLYQSNHEGQIVDFIQENRFTLDGIMINPAAYTKSGYAILEALTAIDIPFIEVHLSNIFSREKWHSESIFSPKAIGFISGMKGFSYELSLRGIVNYINDNKNNE